MKPNKTKTYTDSNKTTTYGDIEKRTKETVHNLKAGDNITLNNNEYKIIEIISESTGEAVIYKVESVTPKFLEGDFTAATKKSPLGDLGVKKNILSLKLYFEFHNSENEPNTEALSRIKNIKDVDILRLYDFGTGINKYKEKYCFEISDFAFGHDLLTIKNLKEKYNPGFIEKKIIPQIFKGILRLHKNNIYHCDLKPQNVFYLDKEQKEIVIGDYGSAKTFEFDAEKSSRKTTTVKGTDFYLPPEQARGFISEKNDYYSFGMILLHLFYPEKILLNENEPKSLSHSKLKQIIERQFEAKPIIDFNTKYERINKLIEGLTLVDFNLRWGESEVKNWLEGKNIQVLYRKETVQADLGITLILGNYTIKSVYDLRDYILSNSNWYPELIEDTENKEAFIKWMLNLYDGDRSKRSAFNRIIKQYSQEGIDFVADAIIRFFIPDHPVIFGLKSFDFAQKSPSEPVPNLIREDLGVMKTTAEAFSYLISDLWKSSSGKELQLYIFRYEFALRQLKDRQTEVSDILKILYNELNVKEKTRADFYNYKVYAYTSVSTKSLNNIKNFLFAYMPSEYNIDLIRINSNGRLHYNFSKDLSEYFSEIGINNALTKNTEEYINIKFPENHYKAFTFYKKTLVLIIDSICIKHLIDKEKLLKPGLELFNQKFKNAYKKLFEDLKKEYDNLNNELSVKIKKDYYVKKYLRKIKSIISNNKYHLINLAYSSIEQIRERIEIIKADEKKQLLDQKREQEEGEQEEREEREARRVRIKENLRTATIALAIIICLVLFMFLMEFLGLLEE